MKKKVLFLGFLIVSVLFFMIIAKPWHYLLLSSGYKTKVETVNLSLDEKIEDFNYLYEVICSSVPMIDDYKNIYGFSFADRKNDYMKLIEKTNNDYDFFCTLNAILEDVPSFHTDLVLPETVGLLNCYNSTNVKSNTEIKAYTHYWNNLIEGKKKEKVDNKYICFTYVDGCYILDSAFSTIDEKCEGTLQEVNGIPVDEYIKKSQSVFNLYYDGKNKKPCRTKIVFNEEKGEDVGLIITDNSGKNTKKTFKFSMEEEIIYFYRFEPIDNEDIIDYAINDTLYLKINSFDNRNGQTVKNILSESSEKVILDLRENYGGNSDFAVKYIYPELFEQDYYINNKWYIPDSIENRKIRDNIFSKLFLGLYRTEKSPYKNDRNTPYLYSVSNYEYKGKYGKNKKLVCLVSHKTGSAADSFVSFIKDKKLGTIIGNNTGGEGLMGSYVADSLPNSKLVFVYMPGGAKNSDGTDNSVVGTAPDKYVSTSMEEIKKMREIGVSFMNSENIEKVIQYDSVLKSGIEFLNNQ